MNNIFSIEDFSFPKGFLWGSATAGHQIEGNNNNSDRWRDELEHDPNDKWFEPSGIACDSYNRFEEDIDLLVKLGHKAYRMSIEWSRIEPAENVFDEKAVNHYITILKKLKEKGIIVFLTMVHFTVPCWFKDKGGFNTLNNLKYFEKYLDYIVPKVEETVDYWIVLNEFNLGNSNDKLLFKYNSFFYHARGYHTIKKYSSKPVSSAHALVQFFGRRQNDRFDLAMQNYFDVVNNEFFFHAVRTGELVVPGIKSAICPEFKGCCDFWAINLYTRSMVDSRNIGLDDQKRRFRHSKTEMMKMPFYLDEFYPECMYNDIMRLTDKPIFITENGCSCDNDDYRIIWLTEYLSALQEAIQDGADVKGFLYWSLLDNYEWSSYIPKFGLIDVNRNTMERKPKRSAYFYKDIIDNNGFKQEILKKYITEFSVLKGE